MKVRLLPLVLVALTITASAQDPQTAPPTQPASQSGGQGESQTRGGGRGGWGAGGGMGRGVLGTVTEVAADHYTIKTDAGLTYTIHYSALHPRAPVKDAAPVEQEARAVPNGAEARAAVAVPRRPSNPRTSR